MFVDSVNSCLEIILRMFVCLSCNTKAIYQ
jgi:hypothetical protein